jgi:tetratricopeptide (TPR) repeat protein
MNCEQQYRELQYIWSRATECLGQNRHGLAIRLLKEGIQLAESPSYDDPSRLYQMKRDLAGAYADLGAYEEAIHLYKEVGRFDSVGNLLLALGQDREATTAYRKAIDDQHLELNYKLARVLFMLGRYEEALDAYIEGSNNLAFQEAISRLGKTDCMLALAGLQARYGFERLKQERKNWRSSINASIWQL